MFSLFLFSYSKLSVIGLLSLYRLFLIGLTITIWRFTNGPSFNYSLYMLTIIGILSYFADSFIYCQYLSSIRYQVYDDIYVVITSIYPVK